MKKGIYLVQIYDDQYWVYACWDGEYFYMSVMMNLERLTNL